jgi:hypothetical protein
MRRLRIQSVNSVPPIPTTIIVIANVQLSMTPPALTREEAIDPMASLTNKFLGMKKRMRDQTGNNRQ